MAISIVMPALELAQETGRLIAWRKREGDRVAKGEPLLDVETDKAVVEIEAPGDGILAGITAADGSVVPVGETIGWVVAPGEAPPAEDAAGSGGRGSTQSLKQPLGRGSDSSLHESGGPLPHGRGSVLGSHETKAKISPKARRLAREHGIDLTVVHGSGPEGEILASDVEALVNSQTASAPVVETPGRVGHIMAERMAQSWTTVPHFFVVREIDAGAVIEARARLGGEYSHTDFLVALVARVLKQHPRLNASWSGEAIELHRDINVALAVAVDDGVVAPVIHRADQLGLEQIATARREAAERARAGRLHPSDIAGATFTISNLGMYNVDAFSAIITPPQAAVLAVGRIAERVVPVDGRPGIRPMMTLTLSCDHRVVDGARAAAFLNDLASSLSEPEERLRSDSSSQGD